MGDYCAIAAWKWHGGIVFHDVWIKRRGQEAIDKVRELIEMRFESIKADTVDGVFVIERHGEEFYQWCKGERRG